MLICTDGNGNWRVNGVRWNELREGCTLSKEAADAIFMAIHRLKDYEDTGLTPDGADRLIEEKSELVDKIFDLKREIEKLRGEQA